MTIQIEPGLLESARRIVAMVDSIHPRTDAKCRRNTVYRILRAYIVEAEGLSAGGEQGLPKAASPDAVRQEVIDAAVNYVRCMVDLSLTPYIRENGRHGGSPHAELIDAVRSLSPPQGDKT